MKKNISLNLTAIFVSLILSTSALCLTVYDNFSGPYIDRVKWIFGELVREIREIEPGNYKLFLKQASSNPNIIPILGGSYPYYESNSLNFINPGSINSIQADVTIVENSITNSGDTSAACVGNWYSDGTSGEGMIGDIQAAIALKGGPSGLFAKWRVYRIIDSQGTTWTDLGWGDFTTPITYGTSYTLYIEYDSVNNRFIFSVGGEQIEFSTGLPPRAGNAKIPFKALSTRVRIDDENSSAFISATFDNVYKNGPPYDDFSSPIIDSTKWNSYEFVREVSNGKLRTKVRTSSASNNEVNNELPSIVPIKAVQAKVTLLDYQNPPGPDFRVGVAVKVEGAFYNDGTPGEGQSGDVHANVRIMANELSTLQPKWEVTRCPDSECDDEESLGNGVFTTPIVLGNTYTLFIEWDGSQFTLKFNDEVAHHTPTSSSINAARLPYINLITELNASPGHNKEATIEALFDDVGVNETTPSQYTLTVSRSGTGSGTVTSSPAGINCGGDCTEDFKVGTKITLKAKADTNSTFTGWSGGGCSGTGTCVVIMNADTAVTAAFSAKTPDISVPSSSVDFGSVNVGKKITKTLKIANNGSGDLMITLSGLEGTDFSIQGSSSVTIKAKKTYSLKVLCTPTSGGLKTATLEIDSNDADTPTLEISLTAVLPATPPDISVAQTPLDFGSVKVGKKVTKTLKIGNNGTGDLMITLSGLEETDFSIQGSSSVTIKAKKSYTLKVLFTPKSAGPKAATLGITSNDQDTPTIDISLSGTGQ